MIFNEYHLCKLTMVAKYTTYINVSINVQNSYKSIVDDQTEVIPISMRDIVS